MAVTIGTLPLTAARWFVRGIASDYRDRFNGPLDFFASFPPTPTPSAIAGCISRWKRSLNRIVAYQHFSEAANTSLLRDVCRAAGGSSSHAHLWQIEGAAFRSAYAWIRSGEDQPWAFPGDLPTKCSLPLHTGMGMAIAMSEVDANPKNAHEMANRCADLCHRLAKPEYIAATFEPLGLIGRLLNDRVTLMKISEATERFGDPMCDFFWHGVGRGSYFSPSSVVPCASAFLFSDARSPFGGIRDSRARGNAAAGLGWATRLVNARDNVDVSRESESLPQADSLAYRDGFHAAAAYWSFWKGQRSDYGRPVTRLFSYSPPKFRVRQAS